MTFCGNKNALLKPPRAQLSTSVSVRMVLFLEMFPSSIEIETFRKIGSTKPRKFKQWTYAIIVLADVKSITYVDEDSEIKSSKLLEKFSQTDLNDVTISLSSTFVDRCVSHKLSSRHFNNSNSSS